MNDFDFNAKTVIAEKHLMRRITEPVIDVKVGGRDIARPPVRRAGRAFCPLCADEVELISFAGASVFFRSDRKTIDRLATQGCLHQIHNRAGEVMVCSKSLIRWFSDSFEQTLRPHAD